MRSHLKAALTPSRMLWPLLCFASPFLRSFFGPAAYSRREMDDFARTARFRSAVQLYIDNGVVSSDMAIPGSSLYRKLWNGVISLSEGLDIEASEEKMMDLQPCRKNHHFCELFHYNLPDVISHVATALYASHDSVPHPEKYTKLMFSSCLNTVAFNDYVSMAEKNDYYLMKHLDTNGNPYLLSTHDRTLSVQNKKWRWFLNHPQLRVDAKMHPNLALRNLQLDGHGIKAQLLIRMVLQNTNDLSMVVSPPNDRFPILYVENRFTTDVVYREMLRTIDAHIQTNVKLTRELITQLKGIDEIDLAYFEWAEYCETDKDRCVPYVREPDYGIVEAPENEMCPICHEMINGECVETKCKHDFCKACLDAWLNNHQHLDKVPCPICRKQLHREPQTVNGLR